MKNGQFVVVTLFLALLAGCASFVPVGETASRYREVQTPHGKIRLAVQEEGKGRPILLLHGLGTSTYTWRSIIPGLSKSYRVIAVDLRGFGASDKPLDDHYSIADQADAIRALIEQENLRDLTVVGHSFGGGITLALALDLEKRQPGRLRNIVLVDSIAYRQPLPIFFRLLKVPGVGELGMNIVPPEVQAEQALKIAYFDPKKIRPEVIAEYARTLHLPAAKHALMKTIDRIVPDNIDEIAARYKTIKLPTLIIWCEGDRIVPVALGRRLHEEIPKAELVVLAECGHLPQEEKPQDTLDAMKQFLARR